MAELLTATESNLARAVQVLRAGDVVAIPTETVYGLAGLTLSAQAARRIHELKGRPANNPLIAHVLDAAGARTLTAEWPAVAD
ncbi:MAG: Sua5/YciO/YrdC/YwlC family protein, partial [Phycisphaerae bacterium]|nr:Sua5/YciO/YrdC/YwlC family protein [Phycisphaerae bacterium]